MLYVYNIHVLLVRLEIKIVIKCNTDTDSLDYFKLNTLHIQIIKLNFKIKTFRGPEV